MTIPLNKWGDESQSFSMDVLGELEQMMSIESRRLVSKMESLFPYEKEHLWQERCVLFTSMVMLLGWLSVR